MSERASSGGFKDGVQHFVNVPATRGYDTPVNEMSRETYTGTIFCPQVPPNGSFLARRNGKVYYTGNSAWLIQDQTYEQHLDPLIIRILRSLTPWWRSYLAARKAPTVGQVLWREPAPPVP